MMTMCPILTIRAHDHHAYMHLFGTVYISQCLCCAGKVEVDVTALRSGNIDFNLKQQMMEEVGVCTAQQLHKPFI